MPSMWRARWIARSCSRVAVPHVAAVLLGPLFVPVCVAHAGVFDALVFQNSFVANVSVPDISTGGIYFDETADKLYLVGNTDILLQGRIRSFRSDGTFLEEFDIAGTDGIGGVAAVPGSSELIVLDEISFIPGASTTRIFRIQRDGTILASALLDNGVIPGGLFASAVAVDPVTGRIWLAESIGPNDNLVLLDADFNYLSKFDISTLGVNILGLDIDQRTGNFIATDSSLGLVEIAADMSAVLATFSLSGFVLSPTSVSIGAQSGRLFVSDGSTTDLVVEFTGYPTSSTVSTVSWPGLLGLGGFVLALGFMTLHRTRSRGLGRT